MNAALYRRLDKAVKSTHNEEILAILLELRYLVYVEHLTPDGERYALSMANAFLPKEAKALQPLDALELCREQFQFYADEHTKAGKLEKAATNQVYADICKASIEMAEG